MILAIDTSTQWLSVALYDAEQQVFLFEKTWRATRRHTIELAPAITNLLQEVGTTIQDVDTLAVATGPGSFTSLRIGLAFSKGIVLANRINLIGVPVLALVGHWELAAALIVMERVGKAIRAPARDAIISHAARGM
ncbi:MAG TPA: tRNA (adenosine(37)-N6)-threonylcarbamoyltransferase complex dimerization subunit type 1 TsaB, partial [Anaerolineaceae bacterium]|nr:tRNA (adenosine(37)-N6)-threonylcarbamoyltransferase complex dimerization subunit type 1 TsaB [Anaerolineaceae bacterium]